MTKKEYTNNCTAECPGLTKAIKKHLEADAAIAPKLTEDLLITCEEFVTECARRVLGSRNGALKDSTVFKWARDYFNDDLYLEDLPEGAEPVVGKIKDVAPESSTDQPKKVLELTIPKPEKTKTEYIEEQLDLFG